MHTYARKFREINEIFKDNFFFPSSHEYFIYTFQQFSLYNMNDVYMRTSFQRTTSPNANIKKNYMKHLINPFYHRIPYRHEHKNEQGSRIHFLYSIILLCWTEAQNFGK